MSLYNMVKQAAVAAGESTNPVNLMVGKVSKAKPLEIEIHSKLKLSEEFLIVSKHLTRHERIVSLSYENPKKWSGKSDIGDEDKDSDSSRNYIGSGASIPYEIYEMKYAKMVFEDGLKEGDEVILFRVQGGHQFFVYDRYRKGDDVWSYPSVK